MKIFDKFPFLKNFASFQAPPSLSLEQASGECAATFKAQVIENVLGTKQFSIADMTGGMGIDTLFLSAFGSRTATYIERNAELCHIAAENFKTFCGDAHHIKVVNADSIQYLLNSQDHYDVIFADPARRSAAGKKLVSIADCEPNLLPHIETLMGKCQLLAVKLSPMLDISVALQELKYVTDLYVVGAEGECKELLALLKHNEKAATTGSSTAIHCVSLPRHREPFTFTLEDERNATVGYSMPQRYLYEPDPALLKAGAFKSIGVRYGLTKLHPNSHLYTSEVLVPDFMGRTFEITDIRKVHKHQFKDITQANLTARNFPTPVSEIRKNIGVKEGGDVYLFATTLIDNSKIIIISKKLSNLV